MSIKFWGIRSYSTEWARLELFKLYMKKCKTISEYLQQTKQGGLPSTAVAESYQRAKYRMGMRERLGWRASLRHRAKFRLAKYGLSSLSDGSRWRLKRRGCARASSKASMPDTGIPTRGHNSIRPEAAVLKLQWREIDTPALLSAIYKMENYLNL